MPQDSCYSQVRAEDVEENLYAAIEKVSDIVTRKMRKVKEKAILKGNWEGSAGPRGHSAFKVPFKSRMPMDAYRATCWWCATCLVTSSYKECTSTLQELPEEVASDEEDIDLDALPPPFPSEVVRTKTLGLKPMSMEEALDQASLASDFSHHSFRPSYHVTGQALMGFSPAVIPGMNNQIASCNTQ